MPLTRNFNDLVKSRVEADPAFRRALFQEAVQTMLDGDVATAKSVLRGDIDATIGFERLSLAAQTPAKSLMRIRAAGQPDGGKTARDNQRAAKADRRASRSECGRKRRLDDAQE
jgi:hypothetical protein